ncbi:MAG: glycosyltransferase [Deltaproteobacteria bacterium]|nr:glycosyltransferase [Deltaproteobacteria bacterium]
MVARKEPRLAVIVATRDRERQLAHMLPTLGAAAAALGEPVEIIVVDNGSSDATSQVLHDWIAVDSNRRYLRVEERGKARALNRALAATAADLVAFTDDDVELPPTWLVELVGFFDQHPEFGAATGRVQMPPSVTDPALRKRATLFGTLPLFDKGLQVCDTHHLYGCNMALRRSTIRRVGGFDERLGPGASGLHEDGELGRRICEAGLRIGYAPRVLVFHTVEADRLTPEFFRAHHQRDARSRFAMDPNGRWMEPLRHLLGAALVWSIWTLVPNRRQSMRARGRVVSHAELLRLRWNLARRAHAGRHDPSQGGSKT